jgi:hypothetical protein
VAYRPSDSTWWGLEPSTVDTASPCQQSCVPLCCLCPPGRAAPSKPRSSRKPPLAPPAAARSTAQHATLPGDANNNSDHPADAEPGAGTDAAAARAAGSDPDCAAACGEGVSASGRRKRKDSGQKRERGKVCGCELCQAVGPAHTHTPQAQHISRAHTAC